MASEPWQGLGFWLTCDRPLGCDVISFLLWGDHSGCSMEKDERWRRWGGQARDDGSGSCFSCWGEERIIKNLDLESHCLHLHLSSNTKNSCDYEQILNLSGPELSHH